MKLNKNKITIKILIIALVIVVFFIKINSKSLALKLFDYSVLIICSGSMEPEICVGDAVVIKKEDTYNVGDVITYNVENKYLVTHRIVEKVENKYITKGDNNNVSDDIQITKDKIEGKVILCSKILGYLIEFSPIIILVLLIIILIWL